MSEQQVRLLQTADHRCGYYPDRRARNVLIDPHAEDQGQLYDMTVHAGFRRSGELIYRPHCRECRACQATRLPVAKFQTNRSQRRCLKRNQDLRWRTARATYDEPTFLLYQRYLTARHRGGGMDQSGPEDFRQFLLCQWADTVFLSGFDADDELIAVAVCDRLASGLSAVYGFFDPTKPARSLGVWLILQQIELARQLGLRYLYLGYWLRGHPKMDYKVNFRPIEVLTNGNWQAHE